MAEVDPLLEEIDADADARLTASGLDRTRRAVAALWAPDIRDGRPVPVSALSPALCDAMVALGYVTPAQRRRRPRLSRAAGPSRADRMRAAEAR